MFKNWRDWLLVVVPVALVISVVYNNSATEVKKADAKMTFSEFNQKVKSKEISSVVKGGKNSGWKDW